MTGMMVSTDEILAAFAEAFVSLPVGEIDLAAEHWDQMARPLLERLERLAQEDDALLFVAIYLMGQQSEQRAFPLLCRLARDPDRLARTMGDGAMQDLDAILVRTFDGTIDPLCALIEDRNADDAVRGCALHAVTRLTQQGRLARQWTADYLRGFAETLDPVLDMWLGLEWTSTISFLALRELVPLVEAVSAEGRLDSDVFDPEAFHADLRKAEQDQAGERPDTEHYAIFGAVERLSAFSTGEEDEPAEDEEAYWPDEVQQPVTNPLRHVGRNDPCICGSGKKYKKCCLGK